MAVTITKMGNVILTENGDLFFDGFMVDLGGQVILSQKALQKIILDLYVKNLYTALDMSFSKNQLSLVPGEKNVH